MILAVEILLLVICGLFFWITWRIRFSTERIAKKLDHLEGLVDHRLSLALKVEQANGEASEASVVVLRDTKTHDESARESASRCAEIRIGLEEDVNRVKLVERQLDQQINTIVRTLRMEKPVLPDDGEFLEMGLDFTSRQNRTLDLVGEKLDDSL